MPKNHKYKKSKQRATYDWGNPEFYDLFFREVSHLRKYRKECSGTKWHADHITPLQHPNVCGLHTPSNIKVIPAGENMKKSNSYWDDMW